MKKLQILISGFLIVYFLIQIFIPPKYTLNADEGTHGLIGLFYKDALRNIGGFKSFSDITAFTIDYIVKYPKLSVHYPPLYHWLLSGVFSISESLFLVRIFNILLTIAVAYIIYKLSFKLIKNRDIAILSSIFFLSFSIIFFFADKIMMDNLQILTFSLGLLYYLNLKEKRRFSIKDIFIFSIILALSFLTKFFSIFLPVIILIDSFFNRRNLVKYILLSTLIAIVFISPYIFFYIKFGFYKFAINVASNLQIVNTGTSFSQFFNFFGFDYLNFSGTSKIDYFNFFKIFGLIIGIPAIISIFWYIWKNKKNPLIISWVILPMFVFIFLFTDIELRFLYILMPLFALACGSFVYNFKTKKWFVLLVVLILISQTVVNIYVKLQEPFYPIEDLMKNIKGEGNILIMQEQTAKVGAYSSVYILYGRLLEVSGNLIRPCVLDSNTLTKDLLDRMGVKYLIDQNNTINDSIKNYLNLTILDGRTNENISMKIFERNEVVDKVDCNFICVLQKKVCIGENLSNILSVKNIKHN